MLDKSFNLLEGLEELVEVDCEVQLFAGLGVCLTGAKFRFVIWSEVDGLLVEAVFFFSSTRRQ